MHLGDHILFCQTLSSASIISYLSMLNSVSMAASIVDTLQKNNYSDFDASSMSHAQQSECGDIHDL